MTPGGRKRISSPIRTRSPHPGMVDPIVNEMNGHMLILTDRGAYNPGETLHFKAILYRGTYEYELAGAGETVEVELYDPEDHLLGTKSLKTSDFGSVEGSFPLVGGSKGGLFSIRASSNSARGSKDVRVDEFVLPTFDVTWEKDDNLYLLGDEVRVAGRVTAYSGHALGSVKARCRIEGQGERDVEIAPDGRFSFKFRTGESARYYGYPITLTIVDNTGETLEFNTHKMVFINLPFSISLRNPVAGRYGLTSDASRYNPSGSWIIRDPYARFEFSNAGYKRDGVIINWEIKNEKDETVSSGKASPDEPLDIDISKLPSGLYKIYGISHARYADGKDASCDRALSFVKAADDDTALNMDAIYFFKELGGEDIAVQFGTTDGPVWAAVELVGSGNVLLEHQIVHLTGDRGKAGSLKTISYARKDSYPETLTLYILFFHKGKSYSYTRTINLPVIVPRLPLEFTRFTDLANPGQEVSLLIKTNPGIECAATIFDKATETIKSNEWYRVEPYRKPEPRVSYYDECGYNGSRYDIYATEAGGRMYRKGVGAAAVETAVMMEDNMVMEEAEDTRASRDAAPQEEVHVREDFDATMHWEPALHSDKDGLMELKFTGCDRLSTYYVQLFAHGEGMINETLRREMKVSIPVKVSIVQPLFLYEGDDYTARVSLSSSMEVPVSGKVSVRFYNGNSYKDSPVIATKSARVTIPAGSSIPFEAPVSMPQGVAELGVRVDFVADNSAYGSDAVFTVIPGMRAVQTLTEAHSAVLLAGADKDAVIAGLRSMFVNADASALVPVERDILGMIKDAIPDSVEPKGTDVISLTEAYYANILARRVGANGLGDAELQEIKEKIVACQNTSGGIAWFQGMESSPTVTAAVLQRIAAMPEAEGCGINVDAAVLYLDNSYFERAKLPWWCGGISLAKYLQTRAMFASVPFSSRSGKAWREFKKEVKNYLTPSKARGLNGQILDKARRLRTLRLLADSDEGKALAKSWGLRMRKCLLNSLDADVESLLQYAVDHRSGGCYYPNAVMPWRGLMESELYAHALLCDLLTCVGSRSTGAAGKKLSYAPQALKTAEGIRIWIMIQKETQHWEDDAAYIEAIASVLRGTPETLQTRVVLMSAEFTKPFPEVKAAGNGFTISRQFVRDDETLHDGDPVHVGDRIKAIYRIWNEENRSFVRVSAPRPASLRPVDQLSGHYGWWLHPMSYGGWSFSPQGYRNVLSDKTEYWFDAYPEENTTITEYFFVTQEGRFQMPAVWVESLYAPHYRANDDGRGPLESD